MATYAELAGIKDDSQWSELLNKIRIACAVKAAAIIDSASPGATALDWAKSTVSSPNRAGDDIAAYVVAVNKSATLSAIYGASDSAIQTNVDSAVDAIYGT